MILMKELPPNKHYVIPTSAIFGNCFYIIRVSIFMFVQFN